ncbi:hypothetical protein BMS3Bbin11_01806 [bacterium BMS3Bbin11]|nr:hypothetical protein BMS3Abin11_00427 [bacterium BMS3Abin11]GBE46705.1 hypothetical protein BMS3Bbin11_01806 [bacterium BMS3Bbin11]
MGIESLLYVNKHSDQKAYLSIICLLFSPGILAADWKPLSADNLHDPYSQAIEILQEPAAALSVLPPDTVGNHVRWVEALQNGEISPRSNIFPETKVEILDEDILFNETSDMPIVLFPHDKHTAWLDCNNCHDKIFKKKTGATKFGMFDILSGRFCGRCHGAVAFPLTECKRCHSVSRN